MLSWLQRSKLEQTKVPDTSFVIDAVGLRYSSLRKVDLARTGGDTSSSPLSLRLQELVEEGLALIDGGTVLLPWSTVVSLRDERDDVLTPIILELPKTSAIRPVLESQGSVTDSSFSVLVSGWVDEEGSSIRSEVRVVGASIQLADQLSLMSKKVWLLLEAVKEFHAVSVDERSVSGNEARFSKIRQLAVEAHAPLSNYLERTIVLTPDRLSLSMRSSRVADDKIIEVEPTFAGAPDRWLDTFDRQPLSDRYDIPDGTSMTRVVISEPVKAVLAEIKRMPGRRVAGARAEAFIRNPISVLGENASGTVNPEQVEQALVDAGISSQRFLPHVHRHSLGHIESVSLTIDSVGPEAQEAEYYHFSSHAELSRFIDRLDARVSGGYQYCAWEGSDLEIDGDTIDHLQLMKDWLEEWLKLSSWSANELFDLSNYSERIANIGNEVIDIVPVIQKRSIDLDWFVGNVLMAIAFSSPDSGETVFVPYTPEEILTARAAIERAQSAGQAEVLLPKAPRAIPIDDANRALEIIEEATRDIVKNEFKSERLTQSISSDAERKRLVLKTNIDAVDYTESRAELLSLPEGAEPALPRALLPASILKPHQNTGVAWLQHLWRRSPVECRGALLADDMGLGKTLQLLTFIAACREENPDLEPVLVVAPLALLANWQSEIDHFFKPGSFTVLTLYGQRLSELRIPKREMAAELLANGITKLLRKDWVGGASIVLTTYETMRDLEFTLAAQPWSIMVCDEAQKIKNPTAMVTRTAKKQRVRFRIACTGTPVENSLADLWCLFDFIQPGLLGALNAFSKKYREPIEAKTDSQKAAVAELRSLIEPQTLRRTKSEVARDLPDKLVDDRCRSLAMSERQRALYFSALEILKRDRASNNRMAALSALHRIRRLCSDPYWEQPGQGLILPASRLIGDSPKLAWLVNHLVELKNQSSDLDKPHKVIVFCEFRDLQFSLQKVIRGRFELHAAIVNGDTTTSAEALNNRQRLIDKFQSSPGFDVIILSPLAVGFGVNIQAANHVIHFTRTWNPAKEDQATDRAYRIGQTRDVTVYYPSVVGDGFRSFDEILHDLLEWRRGIAQDMLNAPGELTIEHFEGLHT